MSPDERRLLGCVYIDPPEDAGFDAGVSYRVRGDGAELEKELGRVVRRWVAEDWPFGRVAFPGGEEP